MFTGLVTDIGEVVQVEHMERNSRVTVSSNLDLSDLDIGESIAIDGACYTVVEFSADRFAVDISPESLDRTTAGSLKVGDTVHLERALRLSDRLGGHLVLGHVDGVGQLKSISQEANAWHLVFSSPESVVPFLVSKGCVTVNGVSLTVNRCDEAQFNVTIVPHTHEKTRLTALNVGDFVNLEADVIGKYVASLMVKETS
jgi:riboflavin synthase